MESSGGINTCKPTFKLCHFSSKTPRGKSPSSFKFNQNEQGTKNHRKAHVVGATPNFKCFEQWKLPMKQWKWERKLCGDITHLESLLHMVLICYSYYKRFLYSKQIVWTPFELQLKILLILLLHHGIGIMKKPAKNCKNNLSLLLKNEKVIKTIHNDQKQCKNVKWMQDWRECNTSLQVFSHTRPLLDNKRNGSPKKN